MCQSQSGFVSNAPSLNVLQKTNVSSPFTTTLSTTLSIKLDRDNFLLWKSQLLPTTRGHGIEDYLFGTKPQPPKFLESQDEDGHNIRIINPEFEQWNRENQLLLSWLFFFSINCNPKPICLLHQFTWTLDNLGALVYLKIKNKTATIQDANTVIKKRIHDNEWLLC